MSTLQICCILLLVLFSLVLIVITLVASSWWTLDIVEYNQEWKFGLWKYCHRGGVIDAEMMDMRALNKQQWSCDWRTTLPTSEKYRSQADFVSADHNETLGAFWREVLV